jgi:hypothetical protein
MVYYDYYSPGNDVFYGVSQAMSAVWIIFLIPALVVLALTIAANWKLYEKAGEPGWAAIVPFYNSYTLYKISWGNGWFFFLAYIPFVSFVIYVITMVKLSQAFGKDGAWAIGLIFLNTIFLCIMAFSKDTQYVGVSDGSAAAGAGYTANGQQGFQNPYSAGNQTYRQPSSQNSDYYYQPTAGAYQNTGQSTPSSNQDIPYAKPAGGSPNNSETSVNSFCPNCGAKFEGSPKFCHKCGKPQ